MKDHQRIAPEHATTVAARAIRRFDTPLDPEDVPPFHAARILLLLLTCGKGRTRSISGRTKLAKLDFFVRYPRFLERAADELGEDDEHRFRAGPEGVEASMVRYRFGPWDHRYQNLLAQLEGRQLVRVNRSGKSDSYGLTPQGLEVAGELARDNAFASLVERCSVVRDLFGEFTGTQLKEFVYRTFADEVAALPSQARIREPDGADS
jgi:hypothetical protein